MDFTSSPHCVNNDGKPKGVHCQTCRTNVEWRTKLGAPEVCPYGITAENLPKPELPPLTEQAKNLAVETTKFVVSGMEKRTDEEAQKLVTDFCEKCEFYIPDKKRCSKCGCFMSVKTTWKSAHCPIKKW